MNDESTQKGIDLIEKASKQLNPLNDIDKALLQSFMLFCRAWSHKNGKDSRVIISLDQDKVLSELVKKQGLVTNPDEKDTQSLHDAKVCGVRIWVIKSQAEIDAEKPLIILK